MKQYVKGANPYMPLWEHVPDGEPRVFEHNGEKRVYVYGSHDIERTQYCGRNYVAWSAPVTDLPRSLLRDALQFGFVCAGCREKGRHLLHVCRGALRQPCCRSFLEESLGSL